MTLRRTRPALRRAFALLLVVAACGLAGCVYLRLLELKKQFARFDEHFVASTADGVAITCLDPLLKDDDVRWLGVFPEKIVPVASDASAKKEDEAEKVFWQVRWLKEAPPGAKEDAVYDVELSARFDDGRLAYVAIPERYFQFFAKELFVNLLRSTGQARINREARSAEVENAPSPETADVKLPTLDSIDAMLGRPTTRTTEDGREVFRYRYRPITTEKKAKPLEVTFTFDPATRELHTLVAKLPTGTINFRVAPPEKKAR